VAAFEGIRRENGNASVDRRRLGPVGLGWLSSPPVFVFMADALWSSLRAMSMVLDTSPVLAIFISL